MDKIVSLAKRRGFVFPGSEIYGGCANTWDYGPYGVQLKKNIYDLWWKTFVQYRDDIVGLDASILMNPKVWEASGHVASFSDPLIDSKSSGKRYRADKLIEQFGEKRPEGWAGESTDLEVLYNFINDNQIPDPETGECNWTMPRKFNLMFKTQQGVIEDKAADIYLRPETAQGIFVNFKTVQQTSRKKVPFGIAQMGKAFRNEITPGNFTFRTREFEQMEIEYFVDGRQEDKIKQMFEDWKKDCFNFYNELLGVRKENMRFRDHEADELSHYSTMTTDIEYKFPFGWGELMGIAYRGCYDLSQHQEHSGQKLEYMDPYTNEKYIPHVIEPSFGLSRATLVTLLDAYDEDEIGGEKRLVMRFSPKIAPVKAAILPLMKKNGLAEKAQEVFNDLKMAFTCEYDDGGAIGKRYRRQDEIGTPFCITIDFDTLEDDTVTLRDRDSAEQKRVKISQLKSLILAEIL
jgi:glycyl-tRNA synthetase